MIARMAIHQRPRGNADFFAFPPAQGCGAIFDARRALKMKESGNRVFAFRADDCQDGNSSASKQRAKRVSDETKTPDPLPGGPEFADVG
jgi:hypothetical protein